MAGLLECVPNFSEGCRADAVSAIAAAMAAVRGVAVLDRSMDADHNRAVVTLAGPAGAVADAAVEGAREAVARIDLRGHRGAHMRMGALDVCPFVPLPPTAMPAAVATAREVGRRIAGELGVPVFLYGHAAASEDRRLMSRIRNLGFERLGELVGRDPRFVPDFGPARLHPTAGAVAVGARRFLVAFNVELDTDDVGIARRIARRVRESDGGLPGVQARGFALPARGRSQVSMNLLDFEVTPLRAAFDAVRELAAEEGVEVVASELVGLAPRAALDAGAAAAVRLVGFDPRRQVLEERLKAAGVV